MNKRPYNCAYCGKETPWKGHSYANKYCSLKCNYADKTNTKEMVFEKRYIQWLNNEDMELSNTRRYIRKFVERRDGYKCKECGIDEWNNKPITLWCDHIDGDASNDNADNFRLVCPNCDSQSETFGGKNTGRGRKSRGMKPYG